MKPTEKLTYKDSGVDITAGYKSVELIKAHIAKTYTKGVVSEIGGFGGLFAIDKNEYEQPILVAGTDGVGTKLLVAFMADKHDTIGEDCVAMCVNDVLCVGAKPLFFLDYVATGKLKPEHVAQIVEGIANGCVKARAALIGGETAEMPGLYSKGHYDLAGFAVGIVDRKDVIDGSQTVRGDVIIGIPSNGLHSNGFSLVRKVIFEVGNYKCDDYIPEFRATIADELLRPTFIYVNPVYDIIRKISVKGISHITGGGFYENIPRMLPSNLRASVSVKPIPKQAIFEFLKKCGNIDDHEMYSTFNMGIGMAMTVSKDNADKLLDEFKVHNIEAVVLGEVVAGERGIDIEF